jgi:hypothetical protein
MSTTTTEEAPPVVERAPLSPQALALHEHLLSIARGEAARRSVGYAILHEDTVGGVDNVIAEVEELRLHGVDIHVSAGERDRVIVLPDVRLTA